MPRPGTGRHYERMPLPSIAATQQFRQPARAAHGQFSRRASAKLFAPEGLPPSDGCCVDIEQPRKLADPPRRWSLPHRADQDDHGSEVNLPAEEPHRWRGRPLSTSVTIAAEAEPVAILLGQIARATPRCSRVIGAVEASTARACVTPSAFGQVLINRPEKGPETSTMKQVMPCHDVLLELRTSIE